MTRFMTAVLATVFLVLGTMPARASEGVPARPAMLRGLDHPDGARLSPVDLAQVVASAEHRSPLRLDPGEVVVLDTGPYQPDGSETYLALPSIAPEVRLSGKVFAARSPPGAASA